MTRRTEHRHARPSVSVIMPTYNRADLILQSIASVVAQSWSDWELIVVDDGSEDDTIARIEALRDHRITVLGAERIGNVARLRNLGIAKARGDYLAFLDSDDVWIPSKLALGVRTLAAAPGCWCYGDHGLLNPGGIQAPVRVGRFEPVSGWIVGDLLAQRTSAAIMTWLVPRALLAQAGGFDETLSLHDDFDLALRLAETAQAVAIPRVLGYAREHLGRMTKTATDQHAKTALIFERAARRASDRRIKSLARRQCSSHLGSAARLHLRRGQLVPGLAYASRALLGL